MRNRIMCFGVCLFLLTAAGCQPAGQAVRSEDAVVNFTILYQNDNHGAIIPATVAPAGGGTRQQGGFVTLSRYVEKYRAANPGRTMFFNTGDWFQGTPEGNESKGESVIDLLNALQIDAAAIGNHDFDFGAENAARLVGLARFPVLANNLIDSRTGRRPAFLPVEYWRKEIDGVRFIAFGILGRETAGSIGSDFSTGYRLEDDLAVTRAAIAQLRGQCDVLICLSHSGVDVDKELARQCPELDLIIGGHSHTAIDPPYTDPNNRVIVLQAGAKGATLGKLDIAIDRATRRIANFSGTLVPLYPEVEGLPPADLDFVARVNRWTEPVAAMMAQVFGTAATALTRRDLAEGPASSLLGNWMCDVMRAKTNADIAFHNRSGLRSEIPAGPITKRHLYEVSPFGNQLATVSLTGEQVREVVEHSLNTRHFLEVSGLVVKYVAGPAAGQHIIREILVAGRPLQDSRAYTVTTNDFIAGGGSGFSSFLSGRRLPDTGMTLLAASEDRMRSVRTVTGPADNRYVRVAR